jgi:hypothetical protein
MKFLFQKFGGFFDFSVGDKIIYIKSVWFWMYFYAPQIAVATTWMANTGWRAIPSWYHSFRQRW